MLAFALIFITPRSVIPTLPPALVAESRAVQNKGQWPENVRFMLRSPGMNVWVKTTGLVYEFFSRDNHGKLTNCRVKGLSLREAAEIGDETISRLLPIDQTSSSNSAIAQPAADFFAESRSFPSRSLATVNQVNARLAFPRGLANERALAVSFESANLSKHLR